MHISTIKIRNFRKLENVTIDIHNQTTLFIGANNSGKTSAITAIKLFLSNDNKFLTYDFNLKNHLKINELFDAEAEPNMRAFDDIFPTMDLWFHVEDDDIYRVGQLLPTLDWAGGNLGVRLRYEIKDIAKLFAEYKQARERIKNKAKIFPKHMMDFLSKKLSNHFILRYYLLDPNHKEDIQPQISLGDPLENSPLDNLIKIDIINAQRGMNDENADTEQIENRKLSNLLTSYYSNHLDPNKGEISDDDLNAIEKLNEATSNFTEIMKTSFEPALNELSEIGYPPFGTPNITLNPQIKTADSINHSNALQYKADDNLFLPENYNGLGYQNLIFMTFKMICFRDSWLKYGKQKTEADKIAPIHLVLIEEPEAHLHPQAQQVFIKKAFQVLTSRKEINDGNLTTQMIVSTHSSHIVHECDFEQLRYFKRDFTAKIPSTNVVNLTNIFGSDWETKRFVTRYIKLNHCDLFFADAAILIEGEAERILMPYFVSKHKYLTQSYICILTIGGSHAYRLRPLIESLCIPTLIITDLDPVQEDSNKKRSERIPSKLNVGQKTCNTTLKTWIPKQEGIDKLLSATEHDKESNDTFPLKVAYQTTEGEQTFEDAIKNENPHLYDKINNSLPKAEKALNLLYIEEFETSLNTPRYIESGLIWLDNILQNKLFNDEEAKNE
ncbi:MAG: AAA family ATPase [Bacilli bacterium]|nr:AAA family ATPase [Bacilli bacterium]MBR3782213.1 AAA family ATPase [Alphaproteobacteria bacterium]